MGSLQDRMLSITCYCTGLELELELESESESKNLFYNEYYVTSDRLS